MEKIKTTESAVSNKPIDLIPEMIQIKEASKRTGLSYDCLRKLCLSKKIIHVRAGAKYYINFTRLVEYLNNVYGENSLVSK